MLSYWRMGAFSRRRHGQRSWLLPFLVGMVSFAILGVTSLTVERSRSYLQVSPGHGDLRIM